MPEVLITANSDSTTNKRKMTEPLESILTEFEFVKVLNENAENKLVFIHALKRMTAADDQTETNRNAVLILEKPHFGLDETKSYLELNHEHNLDIDNDVYKKLSVYPSKPYNNIQVQLIYPATDAHLAKYSSQEFFFLNESYEDWLNVTSVYLKNASFDIQWVHNILEHKKESERIVFEDSDPSNGFILLPDIKWDGKTADSLYLLAIVHRKGVRSLRDLNKDHLALLENVRTKSLEAIETKYGIKKNKIRAYLHYQPSFYHLHVHFTHIKFQIPGVPERNHQLNQVIENLNIDSEYYRKASLQFAIKQNDPLYELYKNRFE